MLAVDVGGGKREGEDGAAQLWRTTMQPDIGLGDQGFVGSRCLRKLADGL